MATTISLNLDDNAARGFVELAKQITAAAGAADKLGDEGKELKSDLDPETVARLRGEIRKLASDLDDTKDKAGAASKEIASVGGSSGRMESISTAISATADTVRLLREGFQAAREKIHELAEAGVPEFERLDKSITSVGSSFNSFIAAAGKKTGLAAGIEGMVSGVEYVMDALQGTTKAARESLEGQKNATKDLDAVAAAVAEREQSASVQKIGTLNEVRNQIAQQKQLIEELGKSSELTDEQWKANAKTLLELHAQESALLSKRSEMEKLLTSYQRARAGESEAESFRQIASLEEIDRWIEQQGETIRELGKHDALTSEQMEEARNRLLRLDVRRKEILTELKDAERRSAEESKRLTEEAQRAKELASKEELANWTKLQEMKLEASRKAAEEEKRASKERVQRMVGDFSKGISLKDVTGQSVDIERNALQQIGQLRQQAIQAYVSGDVKGYMQSHQQAIQIYQQTLMQQKQLREKFGKEGNVLDQIKGQFGNKDVLNQVFDDRLREARQKFVAGNKDGLEAFRKLNDGRSMTDDERTLANRFRRDAENMRKDVQRNFNRDVRQGRIGEDETGQAMNNLVGKVANNLERSGKLGKDQVDAIRQLNEVDQKNAEATQQQQELLKQVQEESRQTAEKLDQIMNESGNGTARARRGAR